jgi:hypothetical protein
MVAGEPHPAVRVSRTTGARRANHPTLRGDDDELMFLLAEAPKESQLRDSGDDLGYGCSMAPGSGAPT